MTKRTNSWFNRSWIEQCIGVSFARCTIARAIGGIALQDIVNSGDPPPYGWQLDPDTMYFLPPEVAALYEAPLKPICQESN